MHSRVFQISTTQIDKENYLNEDTLNQFSQFHPAERNVRTCIGRHDTLYR